jgi:hypothetical protein
MSFNLAITAAASDLSSAALSTQDLGSGLSALESILKSSRLDQVGLNPQPLPPREEGVSVASKGAGMALDDWCGTVPRHFPPPPPPSPLGDLLGGLSRLPG